MSFIVAHEFEGIFDKLLRCVGGMIPSRFFLIFLVIAPYFFHDNRVTGWDIILGK